MLRRVIEENRLPACSFRQLAEKLSTFGAKSFCDALVLPASCRQQQASSLRSPSEPRAVSDLRFVLRQSR